MENTGVIAIGIKAPIIKKGDDIIKITTDLCTEHGVLDGDVIGITESVVARAAGNYVTVDDIASYLELMQFPKELVLFSPIMSRNRFSVILKGFARYSDLISIIFNGENDEQGNPNYGINEFTGVDIQKFYRQICESEKCHLDFYECGIKDADKINTASKAKHKVLIDCRCHPDKKYSLPVKLLEKTNYEIKTLKDILSSSVVREDGSESGFNKEWGLLGSNKAGEELLKLFPDKNESNYIVNAVKSEIFKKTGKSVEVMIYGDGCFKDPVVGIWEFADPVTSPAYTDGLMGSPNELKIKYLADSKYKDLSGEELETAIDKEIDTAKNKNLVNSMASQGTTPRLYVDLLASLMDLVSGSGQRKTPIVLVRNYFH